MDIRIVAAAHNCQAAIRRCVRCAIALLCVGASFSSPAFAQEPAEKGGLKSAPTRRALAKVTPTHYNIDVAFEPEKHFLRATAAVTLRVNEKTDAIEFELNRHLTLRSVTDAQGRSLEFIRSGRLNSHKLVVRLAESVEPGRGGPACPPNPANQRGQTRGSAPTDSSASAPINPDAPAVCIILTFTYDGALPPGPLDYITEDGILLRDESRWYPATDLAAFTENEISVRLGGNWNMSVQHQLGVKEAVSSRAIVAIPFGPTVTNTEVLAPIISGVALPVRLNIHINYVEKFNNLRQTIADTQIFFVRTLGISGGTRYPPVADFSNRYLNVYQAFPGQQGAVGYSAPGFLVVSEDVVKWHGYPGFAPSFLPHEVAHQWFPIEVTLASEEDGWLAESLAEYLAWRYLEEKQPDDARRMVELAMRNTLAYQPPRPLRLGLKLFALEDWDVTHATLYQRGMLVWRTLETVIDRERVDAALREYYLRHRGGPASIADFRKICEEISGRDLGWFFDYYINGTELPEISLRRLPSAAPNELAGEILVRNAPPGFQVRVEMRVTTATGVIDHSVATRGDVTPFAIDVRAPVTSVTLDPRMRLLRDTEAARRHRAQLKALYVPTPDGTDSIVLVNQLQAAIELDPENLADNHQNYLSMIGWVQFFRGDHDVAWATLDRALALESLDPMATDFHRAWARVYRARIALARGDKTAARAEAEAGLAMKCPALESKYAWPEASAKETTAAEALKEILAKL